MVTSFAYEALNRVVSRTGAADAPTSLPSLNHAQSVTTFHYDTAGNLVGVTNARGYLTTSSYDALNRLAVTQDALAQRTTVIYDISGNIAAFSRRGADSAKTGEDAARCNRRSTR